MKGRINEYGMLNIDRAGDMKEQKCPYAQGPESMRTVCCDYCPHFGEPEAEMASAEPAEDIETGRTLLRLCHGTVLVFDEFTDERSAE